MAKTPKRKLTREEKIAKSLAEILKADKTFPYGRIGAPESFDQSPPPSQGNK